jgi:hypothetical protein
MGSVGDAYDNAMCESFFATLECELLDRRRFETQAEARLAVFSFIEGFYNRQGFPTLMPFEADMATMNMLLHTLNDLVNAKSSFTHALIFSKIALDLGNSTAHQMY